MIDPLNDRNKMRVCYVTHSAPCGIGETFIIQELLAIRKHLDVVIVPLRPRGIPQDEDAKKLFNDSIILPLLNFKIAINFLFILILNPLLVFTIFNNLIVESRSLRVLLRNLCVLPKAFYVSKILKDMGISHIHCHWASIQTTFGLIIAKFLGIDFSFTAHRYDIDENNMLRKKVLESSFVRTISENGKSKVIQFTELPHFSKKIHVIHMGVHITRHKNKGIQKNSIPVLACPANIVEVKGHKYLVEACSILKSAGLSFKCLIIGDGPDIPKIGSLVIERNLENEVSLEGYYPHSKLMNMMKNELINIVILPSITTRNGESEGIPVTLMEAMSFGIPVISTNTGSIPELLGCGSGIMVEEKNPKELAQAVNNVLTDKNIRETLQENGFQRVYKYYNIQGSCKDLANLIKESIQDDI